MMLLRTLSRPIFSLSSSSSSSSSSWATYATTTTWSADSATSRSENWRTAAQSASALTAFPRLSAKLRRLLLDDADRTTNWRERIDEVDSGGHPLGSKVRTIFKEDKEPLQVDLDSHNVTNYCTRLLRQNVRDCDRCGGCCRCCWRAA